MGHAESILKDINVKAADLANSYVEAERGFVQLGWMILEASEMQYWAIRYDNFTDYLKTVAQISGRTVSQLRQYFLTVRDLSNEFSAEQLTQMGITKAIKVRQSKDTALVIPPTIRTAALDNTVTAKELQRIIKETLKLPEEVEGDWYELDGFYVTAEQRATLEQALDVAKHTEPLTKSTVSESAQSLDVMMKFAMEFLGAHNGDGN